MTRLDQRPPSLLGLLKMTLTVRSWAKVPASLTGIGIVWLVYTVIA